MLTLAIVLFIWAVFDRPKKASIYYNGPKSTNLQKKQSHKAVLELVEQFPDGQFSNDNPEYLQELIASVDISEISKLPTHAKRWDGL